ncbi:MAG: response regulator, partial [Pseudomonadales bacterium]
RDTLGPALEDANFTVDLAEDGEQAAKMLNARKPDIVVTDIIMPNKEGIETIIEFRRIAPDVPIIAISGGGRTRRLDFLDIAAQLGAAAALPKPFLPSELIDEIERVLAKRD